MPVEWNPTTRRFIRDGKPIPPAAVRQFVIDAVERAKERIGEIAKSYLEHRNTAQWLVASKDEIRNMHSALAMLVQGGREQMTNSAWSRVGNRIKSELGYLRGFERDISNGKVSDAQLLARAIQYAEAGYVTYQQMVAARERAAGMLYVEWTLDEGAEHCDGCVESAGIHAIEDAPELGSNECGSRCRCDLNFLESEDIAA